MSLVDMLVDKDEERAKIKRINGVAPAIVTQNNDPEGLGRLKVKLPWLTDDSETDWVRMVSFMVGKEFGAVFMPEVNDEVLVAFEQGDVNHPIVIGALWNMEDAPPETNADGKNHTKILKMRSGHVISFNDDSDGGKAHLEIKSSSGHTILLDDESGNEKVTIKDKSEENLISLDAASNTISIESGATIKVKGKKIEIEADSALSLKSNGTVTIKGTTVKIN